MTANRVLTSLVSAAVVGMVFGLGGATLAASAGNTSTLGRPRTLLVSDRSIYAFALGAHRITWVSRAGMRGRYPGCEMYARSLRTRMT